MTQTSIAILGMGLMAALPASAAEAIWLEGEAGTPTVNASGFDHAAVSWYRDNNVERDLLSPGTPGGSSGDWLVYYANPGSTGQAQWSFQVSEGGSYTFWIRCNTFNVVQRYAFDSATLQPMDLTDARENVNALTPGHIDLRFVAWVKVTAVSLPPGTHTLTVAVDNNPAFSNQAHAGIDALALVNFPWAPSGGLHPPTGTPPVPAKDAWYPFVPDDDPFSPRSITDMSALVPAPAGQLGHLIRVSDHLEFEQAPGVPVKFWGAGAGMANTPLLQEQQAKLYAKNGIRLVRFHPIEGLLGPLRKDATGRHLDPQKLDQWDHWFATLKAHGIYMTWSSFYPHLITADDGYPTNLFNELSGPATGKNSGGLVNFMPALQDAEWQWLRTLLLHTNPYTGMRYVDDPALAVVETHNEDCLYWWWPLGELANAGTTVLPLHRAQFQTMWMNWVKAKYVNDTALQGAWGAGMQSGDSVNNASMKIYGPYDMAPTGYRYNTNENARLGDYIHFLNDTQKGYYTTRESNLRSLGYKGVTVTTAWQSGSSSTDAALIYSDDSATAIDRHAYSGGGSRSSYAIALGPVYNDSALAAPGHGILATGMFQVEDKPFMMTEWSETPPNQWKAEMAPLFAFYGMGLQGWDASHMFTGSRPRMGGGWPDLSQYVLETPAYLGQFPALSFAIAKQHIAQGALAAARRFAPADVFQGTDPFQVPTTNQTPNEVLAIGRVTAKVAEGLDASTQIDWSSNWDKTNKILTSTTGELVWDYANQLVTVRAAKTEAIIGFSGGKAIDLPALTATIATPFVSLIFTALDDQPLASSAHVLITALARDQQVGAVYAADGGTLTAVGGPPLLLEPVQASITFKGDPITSAKVVDQFGVPTAQDIERTGNTVLIDGRYSTYYYEITRAAPDGGVPTTDGGSNPDGGTSATLPTVHGGCGCGAGTGPALGLLFAAFLAMRVLVRIRSPRLPQD